MMFQTFSELIRSFEGTHSVENWCLESITVYQQTFIFGKDSIYGCGVEEYLLPRYDGAALAIDELISSIVGI